MYNLDELIHVVPLASPVDTAATTVNSDVIGVKEYHAIEFGVMFGTITGDTVVVTVEECDDTVPTNVTAIAFKYRLSSAVGTDSMGAITDATATGVTIAATDDDKLLLIDVDPRALTNGRPYLRVVADPGASASAVEIAIFALLKPRYAQRSQLSAVD
jgi:hypothetical protein